jgi:hypothetical protein
MTRIITAYGIINSIHRFQAIEKSSHSTSALYLSLCNNPRQIQFIHEETVLLTDIPGPIEPSLEEMNNIMDLVADNFLELGKGRYYIE